MKNFIQRGDVAVVAAPADTLSGDFIVVGALYGVAQNDALSGVDVPIVREGVFDLPKASGAWSKGDALYWDSSAKNFTKTVGTNKPVGIAFDTAASGDTTGSVSLDEVPTGVTDPVVGADKAYKMVSGEVALDGSNPTPVATGLTSILGVALTLKKNSAPGVGTSVVTYDSTGGTLNLYGWKPTSNADPTLIASTGTETVGYVAFGT